MQRRMLIYVAGPLTTSGLVWQNIRNACHIGTEIKKCGHFAYVPHLSAFWAMTSDEAEAITEPEWMEHCFEMVRRCDALYRIEGSSRGSDKEVALAYELGRKVYYSLDEIPQLLMPVDPESGPRYSPPLPPVNAWARELFLESMTREEAVRLVAQQVGLANFEEYSTINAALKQWGKDTKSPKVVHLSSGQKVELREMTEEDEKRWKERGNKG